MKTLKFKTNINCSGCVATVTPYLNAQKEIESWNVETTNPQKVLTVQSALGADEIIGVLVKAGYKGELIG